MDENDKHYMSRIKELEDKIEKRAEESIFGHSKLGSITTNQISSCSFHVNPILTSKVRVIPVHLKQKIEHALSILISYPIKKI